MSSMASDGVTAKASLQSHSAEFDDSTACISGLRGSCKAWMLASPAVFAWSGSLLERL